MFWRLSICSVVLIWLIGCVARPRPIEPLRRSQPLLGTFVTITAYGAEREHLQQSVSAAFDEIRRIDAILSIHRPGSEASRLNASAGKAPVQVSPELYSALQLSQSISQKTFGAFDVTIGPLAQLWGFIWKEYRLPTRAELNRVLPLVSYTNLALHPANRVSLQKPGMFVDFGGIGKGVAVDRAIELLRNRGIQAAMVKAGGDLRVFGLPPREKSWPVQIEDPRKAGARNIIHLVEGALSTSGNYENYFEANGQRYSHIIDPRTGYPVQGLASCTVVAATCAESDALATAFFVLGIERTFARFGQDHPVRFLNSNLQVFESEKLKNLKETVSPD